MEFELIGKFKRKFIEDNGSVVQGFGYIFDVMLLHDFESGTISGFKYNDETTFFDKEVDCRNFPLWAYWLGNLELFEPEEVASIKFHYLDELEQDFLNSLIENDMITFKVNIPIQKDIDGLHLFESVGFNAYDFKKLNPMTRLDFDKILLELDDSGLKYRSKSQKWLNDWVESETA